MADADPRTPVICPVCRRPAVPYCTKRRAGHDWTIRRCTQRGCRHGFVHPRPTLDQVLGCNAEETAASPLAGIRPAAALAIRDVAEVVGVVRQLRPPAAAPGRLLDVGAGDGAYAAGLSTLGLRPHLIDLDPRVTDAAAAIPNATAARETFENLTDPGPYQLVLMSQVLEHALDPHDWLGRAFSVLDKGGMLVVLLPNFGGIYRLLGARDPYLIPPVHVNFFTAGSLGRLLGDVGFRILRIDSDTHIPFSGGLARRVVSAATLLLAPLLRGSTYGIILRAFAVRDR